MTRQLETLNEWVQATARRTRPDRIHWCDGSNAEAQALTELMLASGDLIALNPSTHPDCYLHRSDPDDVARVEHLTFICTPQREQVGPNNRWMSPDQGHTKMNALFNGCMQGRTLYVVPYCMGPIDSPLSRCGVEITDSPYVVASMRIMTRMGQIALQRIEREAQFVKGLHSIGELNPERRFILHFPEEGLIQSYGSGYGGNALLGKKCHALRIATWQGRQQGWLAEHMLIVGIETPQGATHYIAAAFPSACGKTNLSMLIPPPNYCRAGWKVWTVGDDICWMQPGADGRLWAINPEAGFFGVAPGTSRKTNLNALATLSHDTIFTNVGLTSDGQPWWEGLDKGKPAIDWQGRTFDPAKGPAAHPNSRFTVRANQCPSWSAHSEDPQGIPISAIIFGGRRANLIPLVFETRDWTHGVLAGASMSSETTAAATGQVGVLRRDPMAMKPFCGYNFGDYFAHWLSFDRPGAKLPKIFHVNWFRKNDQGAFMWPGFGDNLRILEWILGRCHGHTGATETPIGWLPRVQDLDLHGLDIDPADLESLLHVDPVAWSEELQGIGDYLADYGEHLPRQLEQARQQMADALDAERP